MSSACTSRELLSEALLRLMEKKDYQKISVKEIAEKAGVSRLTFYRNFASKEEILSWHIEQGFQHYLSELREKPQTNLRSAVVLCFSFWKEHAGEISLFVRQDLMYILHRPFEQCTQVMLEQIGALQNISAMQQQFLIGGMFSGMIKWVGEGCPTSPEEVADEILSMFLPEFLDAPKQ